MKKLKLNSEVVRQLTSGQLTRIVGGVITVDDTVNQCGSARCGSVPFCTGVCDGNNSWAPYDCGSVLNSACQTGCYGPCVTLGNGC